MISVKWMGVFVLCQTVFCIEQPYRLVENTTCLEMKKQDRLSCVKGDEYHCLLDENYINEYEVCREWKWIPKDKCAYFNTYNRGNVDERDCEPTPGFTCASVQHRSTESRNYTACYVKKETTTQISSTSTRGDSSFNGNSSLVGLTTPSNFEESHPDSIIGIAFGVLIPVISVAVAILLTNRKKLQFCRKGITEISEHTIDIEGQPSEREKLLDGNKQKTEQKLVEYIKDATSSTPLTDNKNENNTIEIDQGCLITPENEISSKTSESDDSHKSNPKSEKELVQEIPGNHTKECSNTESPPENEQLTSPSEPPVQTDDLSKAGVGDEEKVSNESGEKEGPSPMPDTEEKTDSESIKEDEDQSKGKGNESENLTLHAGNNGENYSSSEPVVSTSTNQTLISASNNENKGSENGNKKLDCISGGSGEEQSHSFEHKPDDRGNITSSQTESTDGNISSVQKNHENGDYVNSTDLGVDQDWNSNAYKPNPPGVVEKDLHKPDVEGEKQVEVVNGSKEKKGSSDDTKEKTEMKSIKEDNHQSERKCNEDNKENTSTEEEQSKGVFDDTLDSLKKEDDAEKGGSLELHDFLHDVSTKLVRKMLHEVLKTFETNPQSYLTDESKINLVKKLLPPEYQTAVRIDPDGETGIAVPVLYAILQLSLEEEHGPKSGWGHGVKDTDIGVGDDIERLYRVHTLCREIANPEQISLTGYTRLFKVLFEAVDRLDKKGKCKEDYKEFFKRWENLQRNQWFKDNVIALWSVIQKFSLRSSHTD